MIRRKVRDGHWIKVSKVEQGSSCDTCKRPVTIEQQRQGEARQNDDGRTRHGRCEPRTNV
jgi:hypothetical protein